MFKLGIGLRRAWTGALAASKLREPVIGSIHESWLHPVRAAQKDNGVVDNAVPVANPFVGSLPFTLRGKHSANKVAGLGLRRLGCVGKSPYAVPYIPGECLLTSWGERHAQAIMACRSGIPSPGES
jgi:hypothetical protein